MKEKSVAVGLLGMFGIYGAMAFLPLAEILPWTAEEFAFFRGVTGVLGAALYFLWKQELPARPSKELLVTSCAFTVATYAVFKAILIWGSSLSMMLLDLAVLVPFAIVIARGGKISRVDAACFLVALCGVSISLRVWEQNFQMNGFVWALLAMIANGVSIEYSGRLTREDDNTKTLYFSLPLFVLFAFFVRHDVVETVSVNTALLTLLLSVAIGYFNFYVAFVAFKHLGAVVGGVLLLGMTPVVVVFSYLLLGRSPGVDQVAGVVMTVIALAYRQTALAKK